MEICFRRLTACGTDVFRRRALQWVGLTAIACLPALPVARAAPTVAELKQLSIEELMEIEVTSVSRSPSALIDAPSALQVLANPQIRRSGATSLPEALRWSSNLNVAQKNAHDWGISARGFNTELANKLLVMIDGRTVYTPLFSGVRWDVQDTLLEDVDRIEVVSGPGGTLWGANAVNGVINISTKLARDTPGFFAEAGGGNQVRVLTGLRYGGELASNVHYRIYGKYVERGAETLASGQDAGDASRFGQGGFRLDAQTASDGLLTVQGDYYEGVEGVLNAADSKVSGGNLLGRWSQVLANGSDVRLQLYYDRTYLSQGFAAGPLAPAGKFAQNLDTYDLDFQHSLKHGDNATLVWGFGARFTQDRTKDSPLVAFTPSDQDQSLFSVFAQDQFPLGSIATMTLGTKVEHNDYTGIEVEPNVRLQRQLGTNRMVWAAVSRAVRTPSRIDRDIREPGKGLTILGGGRDFRSETVIAYEAGYRAQLSPGIVGSASVFYNEYRNIRSLRSTPVTFFPLYFANDLEGETHGLELAGTWDVRDWWRLRAGYTLLKTDIHVRAGGIDFNNALNENSDPENQIVLSSYMDLPGGVEFDTHLRWVDTLITNNSGAIATVPAYSELGARLAIHLSKSVVFSVVGQNLLDDHHPEFGVPGVNRVEIRRSVFAKITWRY